MKSKRGRLLPFSIMEITFYNSEKETSGYISEIELIESFQLDKNGSLGRLAYGSAGCELLKLLLPEEEPQSQLYSYFISFLKKNETIDKIYLSALFLTFYMRVLSQLGFHPSISYCASCSREINNQDKELIRCFSGERGGIVCETCQKPGDYYISLSNESFRLLLATQTASLNEASTLPISLKQAEKILEALTIFLSHQTGMKAELKSLAFIEKLKNDKG